ncbi:hypothetical protein I8U17_00315 [Thermoactinomyces sp. CICC 10521]|uniref:Pyruvate carboxyltransferase domain-containing protein n=1 Tax=Thermoactinomyces daqus TaxID=1329516 RepID=A0A7W2AJ05_9BACL|nr:hypothetical protein [Thermoactinomyces daqus]MBH8597287.1 hypothetical protein [Thermoactinomyces sp. CICC 10523]MBH8602848.1 hypothetical protein [Thermoactinomyces sp. CICC 10522]MBH8606043.1 hypothetical protein [Thermoactinomyces sp. CICC 10521]
MLDVLGRAVRLGVKRISISDTVGVATPESVALLTRIVNRLFPV